MRERTGFDRRTYAREYARRKRAETLAARNASSATCLAKIGRFAVCGGVLQSFTDGNGRASLVCPLCERKRRGICRECGLPVAGKLGYALRCAFHMANERVAAAERYRIRDPKRYRKIARESYRNDRAKRKARNEYKRLWRKANRDKVAAQKRRANLRGCGRRYQANRRATMPASSSRREANVEPRTCLTLGCEIVVTHRKKKCTRCKERERIAAVEAIAQRMAA